MKRATVLTILVGLISLACGGPADPQAGSPTTTQGDETPQAYSAFLEYMRQIESDYDPAATPRSLAQEADAVIRGRIVDVSPGQSYAPTGETEPVIATSVLKVEVDEVVAGNPAVIDEGFLYVEVAHPAFVGTGEPGATGEGTGERVPFDQAAFAATVPRTVGVFFVDDRTAEPYWDNIFNEGAGRPAQARITQTFVQGFVIADGHGGLVSVYEPFESMPPAWQGIQSLDELVREARGGGPD